MIRAIIFDCFGVIVTPGFHAAFQAMGGSLEADKEFLNELFASYNSGVSTDNQLLEKLSKHLKIEVPEVINTLAKTEHLDHKLLEHIKELRQHYKIGLLSNVGRGGIERYLKDIDHSEYFDSMVLSGEVGFVKPQPEIYNLAAEKLNVDPAECIFIDDADRNCAAAREVGMKAITYTHFEQYKLEIDQLLHHT